MAAENSNGANIEELTGKTEQFIEDNSRNLIIGIAAVAVIIVAVVGYGKFVVEPTETAANEDAWRAEQYFMMDSVDLALNGDGLYPGLYDIVEDHDGTKAAAHAQYELLTDAKRRIASIEARGDSSLLRRVALYVRIQEV